MEQYFTASPDVVCNVLKQRIHVYANGESMIEFDVGSRLTKIYSIDGIPEASDSKVVLSSVIDVLGDKLDSVHLNSKITPAEEQGGAGKQPQDVRVALGSAMDQKMYSHVSTMTMHLNTNKKVFLIINTYA